MKKLALSIGMLLCLKGALASATSPSNIGGVFFSRYYIAEGEDNKENRVIIECDTDTLDTLQTFEAAEVIVIENDSTETRSRLYLQDDELKVKVKDSYIVIGKQVKDSIRITPVLGLVLEARIENGHYLLRITLPPTLPVIEAAKK